MGGMHYLAVKNPSQLGLTLFLQLHCASFAKTDKKLRAPHNQILDLPMESLHTFWSIYLVVNHLKSLEFSYFSPTFKQ